MTTLVELCAGQAGLSMRTIGRPRLAPYRGGKWSMAPQIIRAARIKCPPDRIIWAEAHPIVHDFLVGVRDPSVLSAAVDLLYAWGKMGGESFLEEWHNSKRLMEKPSPVGMAESVARFFLHRKVEGILRIPSLGYLGIDLQARFPDKEPRPSDQKDCFWMSEQLALFSWAADLPPVEMHRSAQEVPVVADALCYMDPSYVNTTGYGESDLSRAEVVRLAKKWSSAGAQVVISEATPIEELTKLGWYSLEIKCSSTFDPTRPRKEWLTSNQILLDEDGFRSDFDRLSFFENLE